MDLLGAQVQPQCLVAHHQHTPSLEARTLLQLLVIRLVLSQSPSLPAALTWRVYSQRTRHHRVSLE